MSKLRQRLTCGSVTWIVAAFLCLWAAPATLAADSVYWANFGNSTISFANLDGSGGGQLPTTGATPSNPVGVAIDAAAGKIYWANAGNNTISFASLDGSGGGQLPTSGATPSGPSGVAIDPVAGKIYWANELNNTISFASLDGSGGGQLPTSGATLSSPNFPALLKAPSGAAVPAISGGSAPGAVLSCSQGGWAADLLGSFLYRAPQSFSYSWSDDGTAIPAATQSSITASSAGNYSCQVTAQNQAGSTAQTSASHPVPSNAFTIGKPKLNKRKGTAKLPVTVPGGGTLTLTGKGVVKQRPARATKASKAVSAAGTVKLLVKAKGKAKRKLNKRGRVKVKVTVTFTPSGGEPASQNKTLKLIKKLR
jgi:hypothetical protein